MRADASTAECLVLTRKEGLLSPVAHDLRIRVTRFEIRWSDDGVRATFDPRSLRVVTATRDGRDIDARSHSDKAKIEQNIATEVLDARRNREIRFEAEDVEVDGDVARAEGTLHLFGRRRPVTVELRRQGERWTGEVSLHQPDFGIKPYTAVMGTLRVRPEVTVRLSLPAED